MLTAEEMSHLCKALKIKLNIYERAADNSFSFNPINHTCKGFEKDDALGILDAICSNHHWQPLTDSMSEAFRQQLLWKNGYKQLSDHSYEAIRQAGRAGLLSETKRFTSRLLHKAIQLRVHNQVAKISQSQADKRDPDNGFYNCIDEVLSQKDLSMLLTMYYFKPNTRNYILNKSLRLYGTTFVADFLKHYQQLPRNLSDLKNWNDEIDKILPCIDKINEDSDLHIAIRKGDTIEAKKLIIKEEDIYLENHYQVSPLHLVCKIENLELLQAMSEISVKEKGFLQYIYYFGLNLYHKDASGQTPLHYAAGGDNPDFAKILLARCGMQSVNLNVADELGKTPIHIAALNKNSKVLSAFLKPLYLREAHHAQDQLGLTPLHYAVVTKNIANIQMLLRAGADCRVNAYA
ncbi:MAG TPA: ankyrin repeat domain-containing protein, partial [Candidatus Berkiella sp.]|nr:ankyrin repeat domain-containing protein [Candidatus Berkiella sp.]